MPSFTESKKLPGVIIVQPDVLLDPRGDYTMIFNEQLYAEHGIKGPFVEHCISTSKFGTIRGLHADYACNKLLQVLHGAVFYVLLDLQTSQWEGFTLSARNRLQLYKPAKYASGLLALTDDALFVYYQDHYYDPRRQQSWRWDDERFSIHWPLHPIIISERDEKADSKVLLR